MSTFPPVADYAFLSNCERSCLALIEAVSLLIASELEEGSESAG